MTMMDGQKREESPRDTETVLKEEVPVTAEKRDASQVRIKVDSLKPTPPRRSSEADQKKLEDQAEQLVQRALRVDPENSADDRKFLREITNLGGGAQKQTDLTLDLLNVRMGELTTWSKKMGGEQTDIPQNLIAMRRKLKDIDPHNQGTPLEKFLSHIPFLGGSFIERLLDKIVTSYQTVDSQISSIENALKIGSDMLAKDNIELSDVLRPQLEKQQYIIQANAYLAELFVGKLDAVIAAEKDQMRREYLTDLLYDVIKRVETLRMIETVNQQTFIGIDLTVKNNRILMKAVDNMLELVTNAVKAGLALQIALIRQGRILRAYMDTKEFAEDTIRKNAAMIRQGTEKIAELYKSPILSLEKVKAAHDDLMAAMDRLDQAKVEGIAAARQNIPIIAEMSANLENRVKRTPAKVQETSVEADLPTRPAGGLERPRI